VTEAATILTESLGCSDLGGDPQLKGSIIIQYKK